MVLFSMKASLNHFQFRMIHGTQCKDLTMLGSEVLPVFEANQCMRHVFQEPRQVICAWGLVLVLHHDGSLQSLKEKPLANKLELLYNKGLYLVALNLAHSEQVACKHMQPNIILCFPQASQMVCRTRQQECEEEYLCQTALWP